MEERWSLVGINVNAADDCSDLTEYGVSRESCGLAEGFVTEV